MGRMTGRPIGLFFLKYFLYIFIGIVLAVLALVCAFVMLLASNLVYPADYAEDQARSAVERIQTAERLTEELIPDLCRYTVFDKDGRVLSGDMGEKEAAQAWDVVNGKRFNGGSYFGAPYYLEIPREAECCVLRYQLIVQYRSAVLRKYLPSPEVLLLVVFLVMVLMIILSVAARFNMTVRRQLSPLAAAADRIQNQDLDFAISYGPVKEINSILAAMDEMRMALKESLEKQWRMEQTKNEQMSALAHDLKTPLTLVRGNTELLDDTETTEEQRSYIDCIMDSTLQMQDYVQMMIEVIRSSVSMPVDRHDADVEGFLEELKRQADSLCALHHVKLQWQCSDFTEKIYARPALLARAFMNIFSNAAEHTPDGGIILFEGRQDETHFIFTISDTGSGFTESALAHAKEQFYMDDDSRHAAGSHYGMGLYIVDTIVKQHDGIVLLENVTASSEEESGLTVQGNARMRGGAKVTVKIPRSHPGT
ncbi:MAG: HAMP domain-containing histidine kinase [Lachnospiraceae bacterium]|nr:HAMP domain-containing histidine kinase [Lachnospiraceae bacterium]